MVTAEIIAEFITSQIEELIQDITSLSGAEFNHTRQYDQQVTAFIVCSFFCSLEARALFS